LTNRIQNARKKRGIQRNDSRKVVDRRRTGDSKFDVSKERRWPGGKQEKSAAKRFQEDQKKSAGGAERRRNLLSEPGGKKDLKSAKNAKGPQGGAGKVQNQESKGWGENPPTQTARGRRRTKERGGTNEGGDVWGRTLAHDWHRRGTGSRGEFKQVAALSRS